MRVPSRSPLSRTAWACARYCVRMLSTHGSYISMNVLPVARRIERLKPHGMSCLP